MPRLGDIVPSTTTITVPFGATALSVTYQPAVVTWRFQKAVSRALQTGDIDAGMIEPLSAMLVSWDLTDQDDCPIGTDPASLTDVPSAIVLEVIMAIGRDLVPNPSRAADSGNGSSPAGSAPSRIGTSS